ncbi:class I SAM-dependent methyltransferase [Micromonospora sp. WMMD734]|uniref:class I SAM-dependent methyltransferase n=1 Tax=Micromonospora sp. WMMD734 TaxID=3404129 RepID=UPI003B95F8A2
MTGQTVAAADPYWNRYYNAEFEFGMGTEDVLAALSELPPVRRWCDLGAGSESLLWSIPLTADHLIAIDVDPDRLAILSRYAAQGQPRPAYTTVLRMCHRTAEDFTRRCRSLAGTLVADCLDGPSLALTPGSTDLITQFGLLGLAETPEHFLDAWRRAHVPLAPGGWCAGANWAPEPSRQAGRVTLTQGLYRRAFADAGIHPHLLHRVASVDPQFPSLWLYTGRKQ